ncbi:hypothetical protein K469DRAFT_708822 [Zopfia rhizophila CBS 207.26]|uniref:Uncharacterized protein n=1 Tax=Zopfia rhizophila CBS 207.26 TaxID=1314779 RepID=A0A6A6E1Q0_9PEZI|nr:hypothetical protein K469DRAFT_708822 [Zopfia rhizophila CBS 207.26]
MRTTINFHTMKSLNLRVLTYVDASFLILLRENNTIAESGHGFTSRGIYQCGNGLTG